VALERIFTSKLNDEDIKKGVESLLAHYTSVLQILLGIVVASRNRKQNGDENLK
jgi:hypothetical protein